MWVRPVERAVPIGSAELLPRQLGEERGERTVEDRRVVSRREDMSQHVLGQAKLPKRIAADRHLKLVPIRSRSLVAGAATKSEGATDDASNVGVRSASLAVGSFRTFAAMSGRGAS